MAWVEFWDLLRLLLELAPFFGQILEDSGGAKSMAQYLLRKFGEEKAPWALVLSGFLIFPYQYFWMLVLLFWFLLFIHCQGVVKNHYCIMQFHYWQVWQ